MKRRTTIWLPEELVARLKKLSRKTGAPMAELFRRAVEAYLKTPEVDENKTSVRWAEEFWE